MRNRKLRGIIQIPSSADNGIETLIEYNKFIAECGFKQYLIVYNTEDKWDFINCQNISKKELEQIKTLLEKQTNGQTNN